MYTFGVILHSVFLIIYLFYLLNIKYNLKRWVLLLIFCLLASNFIYCVKNGKSFTYRGRLTLFSFR